MRQLFPLLIGLSTSCLTLVAAQPGVLTESRAKIEQWVQLRQLISKTKSDWQTDKESLEQTVALYERELKSLDEQISKVSTNNTQAEKEMQEAMALQKSSQAALDRARQFATGFEAKLKQLAPQLPSPLQEIIKPLLVRMPEDPEKTKMLSAERVQVCVGVLNELDKFNNAVNVFSEKRKNDKGEEVAVQTIYVGLGAAYFVNDTGDFAGVGAPGQKGWEWTNKPEIAPTVEAAVKMYRNEQTARFLTLPVVVK